MDGKHFNILNQSSFSWYSFEPVGILAGGWISQIPPSQPDRISQFLSGREKGLEYKSVSHFD